MSEKKHGPPAIKQIKSILPETLDMITETSEHSEESSSLKLEQSPKHKSPRRKVKAKAEESEDGCVQEQDGSTSSRSPRRGVQDTVSKLEKNPAHESPRRKVKAKVAAPITEETEDVCVQEQEGSTSSRSPRRAVQETVLTSQVEQPLVIYQEGSENDESGYTAKLTESDEDESGSSFDPSYLSRTPASILVHEETPPFEPDSSSLMFDYDENDSDDEDALTKHSLGNPSAEDDEELTWRLDRSKSLSDWTVTIHSRGTGATFDYHVHKNLLAVGKRKSEFFANVFRSPTTSGPLTELTLPDTAAKAMPMILDYVYAGDGALDLNSDTGPGLRYLAQFFGIKILFEKVMRFIQRDLNLKTIVTYYKSSCDLGDRKITKIASRHVARNLHLIDVSHELIQSMDPHFFGKVLALVEGNGKRLHVSLLVAKYCQLHKGELDGPNFLRITSAEVLPYIHHTAALSLLGMEADLVVATTVVKMMSMSSLQERCIKALAPHWRELTDLDPERTKQVCRKLPSLVVTELLLKSLEYAKKDASVKTGVARGATRPPRSSKQKKEDSKQKAEHEEVLGKLRAEYEEKMAHLQDLCYEKDKHIKSHYEELSRFVRLPNSHEGKLITSGRSAQPTTMPKLGSKHKDDGYLLAGRKQLKGKQYPLFYFRGEEED